LKDVLHFSRENENNFQAISPKLVIDQTIELLKPTLDEKNIQIQNEVYNYIVKGSLSDLKTMFLQLIENSIDAIGKDGVISFQSISIQEKKVLKIFIRDNGCGVISPERIFDAFYTTKQTGTGLGLTIVRKIISRHKGDIALLVSEPGNTIFEISLPVE
jgi:signal transduction histidine kinase